MTLWQQNNQFGISFPQEKHRQTWTL